MITNELIKNKALDLREVLTDLSSESEQREYKSKVPFVHIPDELIEQIHDHIRMLNDCDWYRKLYTTEEIELIKRYYDVVELVISKYGNNIPDVPEVFNVKEWQRVMLEANNLLSLINDKLDLIISNAST